MYFENPHGHGVHTQLQTFGSAAAPMLLNKPLVSPLRHRRNNSWICADSFLASCCPSPFCLSLSDSFLRSNLSCFISSTALPKRDSPALWRNCQGAAYATRARNVQRAVSSPSLFPLRNYAISSLSLTCQMLTER